MYNLGKRSHLFNGCDIAGDDDMDDGFRKEPSHQRGQDSDRGKSSLWYCNRTLI